MIGSPRRVGAVATPPCRHNDPRRRTRSPISRLKDSGPIPTALVSVSRLAGRSCGATSGRPSRRFARRGPTAWRHRPPTSPTPHSSTVDARRRSLRRRVPDNLPKHAHSRPPATALAALSRPLHQGPRDSPSPLPTGARGAHAPARPLCSKQAISSSLERSKIVAGMRTQRLLIVTVARIGRRGRP